MNSLSTNHPQSEVPASQNETDIELLPGLFIDPNFTTLSSPLVGSLDQNPLNMNFLEPTTTLLQTQPGEKLPWPVQPPILTEPVSLASLGYPSSFEIPTIAGPSIYGYESYATNLAPANDKISNYNDLTINPSHQDFSPGPQTGVSTSNMSHVFGSLASPNTYFEHAPAINHLQSFHNSDLASIQYLQSSTELNTDFFMISAPGLSDFQASSPFHVSSSPSSWQQPSDGGLHVQQTSGSIHDPHSLVQTAPVFDCYMPHNVALLPQPRATVAVTSTLPPRRRGERHKPLTKEQDQGQKNARREGVCIKCRKMKIKCAEGIPCNACLRVSKARIWREPCTKAQFLDIVELGSYFPGTTMREVQIVENAGPLLDCSPEDPITIPMLLGPTILLSNLKFDSVFLCQPSSDIQLSLIQDFQNPQSSYQFIEKFAIPYLSPAGDSTVADEEEKFQWVRIMLFILSSFYDNFISGDMVDLSVSAKVEISEGDKENAFHHMISYAVWVASRFLEISLFHYLQEVSNRILEEVPIDEQKEYIISMITTLMAKPCFTTLLTERFAEKASVPSYLSANEALVDRQNRLRTAFWVYISIAVSRQPAWTDFCGSVDREFPSISFREMAPEFRKSLAAFDSTLERRRFSGLTKSWHTCVLLPKYARKSSSKQKSRNK
ncbi:hypothetical protein BGZ63DRAFT_395959 [Mariannaea sp. PMI_226]|nr:hypothetical protein BGZ63DRAFT_395959 [Mariannaea sp. PMI_226]